jgi:hypothetical protein
MFFTRIQGVIVSPKSKNSKMDTLLLAGEPAMVINGILNGVSVGQREGPAEGIPT